MKYLLLVLFMIGLTVARPPAAHAESLKEKIVGTWLETGKSDNLFTLNADGSYRIFLKKGEIDDLHFLEGTWSLTPDMKITLRIKLRNGRTQDFHAKVAFEGDELVLTDDEKTVTRQRRLKGAVPDRFVW
ncbi:MAG TPA: hypothetical protein VGO11_03285 [Chthoniobacteraceae bacterium]|jgi:hypothetical protein|nr:hypothetical protein [Chthoniobacteraceae bacterium]